MIEQKMWVNNFKGMWSVIIYCANFECVMFFWCLTESMNYDTINESWPCLVDLKIGIFDYIDYY